MSRYSRYEAENKYDFALGDNNDSDNSLLLLLLISSTMYYMFITFYSLWNSFSAKLFFNSYNNPGKCMLHIFSDFYI